MKRGFSLAEVMVAVSLISIAVLALISVEIYSLRAGVTNREQLTASVLGYSILNQRIALDEGTVPFSQLNPVARTVVPGYESYAPDQQYLYAVDDILLPDDADQRLKQITLDVYWQDRNGPHDFQVRTEVFSGEQL